AKKVLAEAGQKEKKEYLILELEKELSHSRVMKDSLSRELGKAEGLIDAQERVIKKQQELAQSDEHKVIPLKDVENFYKEIESEKDEPGVLSKIKNKFIEFLKSKRNNLDSSVIVEAKSALEDLRKEKVEVESRLKDMENKENKLQGDYENLKREVDKAKEGDNAAQISVFRIMSEENEIISKLNILKLHEEKILFEEESFKRELEELVRLIGPEVLHYRGYSVSKDVWTRSVHTERKELLQKLKIRFEDSNMTGSEDVMKEYRETSERDEFLNRELSDLEKSADSLKNLIKDLETRLAQEFKTGLDNINKEFEKLFSAMFGGGEAELVLTAEKGKTLTTFSQGLALGSEEQEEVSEDGKVDEGLDIRVSLPRKKIKSLMMLSGGERALTSIAL
ncbi:MAG: hypothetical protein AAB758_00105, partial [Patescibacteria group bacterium]